MPKTNRFSRRPLNDAYLDLAFPRQVIPARMSPRFGIKHTVIPAQSNSIEVFVNAPCIFAPLPMTNTMRFINGQARTFFIESFPRYVPNDDGSLARLITSASLEVVAEIRSFAKARSRGQLGVALYYYNRIKTILLALRQHAFDKAYDPHSIERRPLPPSLQPLNTLLDELNSSSVHPFTICDQLYVLLLESVGNLTANCTALDELESWTNLERDRLRRLLAE
jgi:hypothetical protein